MSIFAYTRKHTLCKYLCYEKNVNVCSKICAPAYIDGQYSFRNLQEKRLKHHILAFDCKGSEPRMKAKSRALNILLNVGGPKGTLKGVRGDPYWCWVCGNGPRCSPFILSILFSGLFVLFQAFL